MAATELARIFHAVNKILEDSSSAVGLSKRGAMALALIDTEPDHEVSGRPVMRNQGLRELFVLHKISEVASAKKDASTAKSELLKLTYIEIVGKVSVFALTPAGKQKIRELSDALGRAIDGVGLADDERALLRRLSGLSFAPTEPRDGKARRKAPASERGASPKVRRKSNY